MNLCILVNVGQAFWMQIRCDLDLNDAVGLEFSTENMFYSKTSLNLCPENQPVVI